MNSDSSQEFTWWSRIPFGDKVRSWNWKIIIPTLVILVAALFVFINTWNGRYESGYNAGAGVGAAYKPLYEQFKSENQKLLKQHDEDRAALAQLQKRIGQLEGKIGLFGKNATQAEAEEALNQARQIQAEIENKRSETFAQIEEIGRMAGRLEELEKNKQDLEKEIADKNLGVQIRNAVIFSLLALGFLLERFLPRNQFTQAYAPYDKQNTVLASAAVIEEAKSKVIEAEKNDKSEQKLLGGEHVSEQSEDNH